MIVYHQRKAINTNIAVLANTLLSVDLIAALAAAYLAGGELLIIREAGIQCHTVWWGCF